jgi:hypothetical protein
LAFWDCGRPVKTLERSVGGVEIETESINGATVALFEPMVDVDESVEPESGVVNKVVPL